MSAALDIASWALIVAGGAFCVIGAVGILRMPDFYTRVHAASVAELDGGLAVQWQAVQAPDHLGNRAHKTFAHVVLR